MPDAAARNCSPRVRLQELECRDLLIDEARQLYSILTTIKRNSERNANRGEPDGCQNDEDG
jgi:hypothetical protein